MQCSIRLGIADAHRGACKGEQSLHVCEKYTYELDDVNNKKTNITVGLFVFVCLPRAIDTIL